MECNDNDTKLLHGENVGTTSKENIEFSNYQKGEEYTNSYPTNEDQENGKQSQIQCIPQYEVKLMSPNTAKLECAEKQEEREASGCIGFSQLSGFQVPSKLKSENRQCDKGNESKAIKKNSEATWEPNEQKTGEKTDVIKGKKDKRKFVNKNALKPSGGKHNGDGVVTPVDEEWEIDIEIISPEDIKKFSEESSKVNQEKIPFQNTLYPIISSEGDWDIDIEVIPLMKKKCQSTANQKSQMTNDCENHGKKELNESGVISAKENRLQSGESKSQQGDDRKEIGNKTRNLIIPSGGDWDIAIDEVNIKEGQSKSAEDKCNMQQIGQNKDRDNKTELSTAKRGSHCEIEVTSAKEYKPQCWKFKAQRDDDIKAIGNNYRTLAIPTVGDWDIDIDMVKVTQPKSHGAKGSCDGKDHEKIQESSKKALQTTAGKNTTKEREVTPIKEKNPKKGRNKAQKGLQCQEIDKNWDESNNLALVGEKKQTRERSNAYMRNDVENSAHLNQAVDEAERHQEVEAIINHSMETRITDSKDGWGVEPKDIHKHDDVTSSVIQESRNYTVKQIIIHNTNVMDSYSDSTANHDGHDIKNPDHTASELREQASHQETKLELSAKRQSRNASDNTDAGKESENAREFRQISSPTAIEGWDMEKKLPAKEENIVKSYTSTDAGTIANAKIKDENHQESLGREFQTASLGIQDVENKQTSRVDKCDDYHYRRYGSLDFKRTDSFHLNTDRTCDGNGKRTTKEINEDKRGVHTHGEVETKGIARDEVCFHAKKKHVSPFRKQRAERKWKMASMAETTFQYDSNRHYAISATKNKEIYQAQSNQKQGNIPSPSANGDVLELGDRQKFGNSGQAERIGRERQWHGAPDMMGRTEEKTKLQRREEKHDEKIKFTTKCHMTNNNQNWDLSYFSMNGNFKNNSHEKFFNKGGNRAAKPQTGVDVNGTMNIERYPKGYRHPIQRRRSHIKKKGTKFKWNMTIVTQIQPQFVKLPSEIDAAKKAVGGSQKRAQARGLVVSTVIGTTYLFKDQSLLTKRQKKQIRKKQVETKWRLIQDAQRPCYPKKTTTYTSKNEEFGDEESLEDTKSQYDFTEDRRHKVSSIFNEGEMYLLSGRQLQTKANL